jgi:hypothetical protein
MTHVQLYSDVTAIYRICKSGLIKVPERYASQHRNHLVRAKYVRSNRCNVHIDGWYTNQGRHKTFADIEVFCRNERSHRYDGVAETVWLFGHEPPRSSPHETYRHHHPDQHKVCLRPLAISPRLPPELMPACRHIPGGASAFGSGRSSRKPNRPQTACLWL